MTESPFQLLGDQSSLLERPKGPFSALGSLAVHALILLLVAIVPWAPKITTNLTGPRISLDLGSAVPLISPPSPLTQKNENKTKPVETVNLESLLSQQRAEAQRRAGMTQPASPKKFEAPPMPAPPATKPEIEAPKL